MTNEDTPIDLLADALALIESLTKERDALRDRVSLRHREDQAWMAKHQQEWWSQVVDRRRWQGRAEYYADVYNHLKKEEQALANKLKEVESRRSTLFFENESLKRELEFANDRLNFYESSVDAVDPDRLTPESFLEKQRKHVQFMQRVLRLTDGFKYDLSIGNGLFVRTEGEYAPWSVFVNCNDLFVWGCADKEPLTPENIDKFEATLDEVMQLDRSEAYLGSILFCCRQRGFRPQLPVYDSISEKFHPLFDACGPDMLEHYERSSTT